MPVKWTILLRFEVLPCTISSAPPNGLSRSKIVMLTSGLLNSDGEVSLVLLSCGMRLDWHGTSVVFSLVRVGKRELQHGAVCGSIVSWVVASRVMVWWTRDQGEGDLSLRVSGYLQVVSPIWGIEALQGVTAVKAKQTDEGEENRQRTS